MKEHEKIELRSTEVQEILSRPPKWIIRWGITIIFFVISIVLVGSWFFEYPDVVSAKVVLTTENPPAPLVAKVSGKIQELFVRDNEIVHKDKILGIIENPGKYESIISLQKELKNFKSTFSNSNIVDFENREHNLGEIQAFYSSFSKKIDEYNNEIKLNYYQKKIALFERELAKYDLYLSNLNSQGRILKQEYELTEKQYSRDSILYSQKLMSESEYEKSKSALLNKLYNYEQNEISIANIGIQMENINQNIAELQLQKQKRFSDFEASIWESYENLFSAIDSWKHKYVLKAPTDGKVTFNKFWDENQNVKVGETVMTIIPDNEGEIVGKVQLSFNGAGKVKENQVVNIQFANYPYMEFGMVKGKVKSISLAPENNFYTAEIYLPDGLKTFYGIQLEFKQEMQGVAEIITKDIRLLERIVRPLRYILNKNTKLGDQKE